MSDEKLFVGIYVDADLTPRIVTALRQRNYECQSALAGIFTPRIVITTAILRC
jgi:hypothetical protein